MGWFTNVCHLPNESTHYEHALDPNENGGIMLCVGSVFAMYGSTYRVKDIQVDFDLKQRTIYYE